MHQGEDRSLPIEHDDLLVAGHRIPHPPRDPHFIGIDGRHESILNPQPYGSDRMRTEAPSVEQMGPIRSLKPPSGATDGASDHAGYVGLTTPLSLPEIGRRAGEGDAASASAISEAARVLGECMGGVVNLLDVRLVVVGGGVSSLAALYLGLVRRPVEADTFVPDVRVVPAALPPGDSALLGMGLTALAEGRQ